VGCLLFDLHIGENSLPLPPWISKAKNCCASLSISKLLKLARIATMRGSTADRVERLIADHKVDVCTIGPDCLASLLSVPASKAC
jgi:hypothetical protein